MSTTTLDFGPLETSRSAQSDEALRRRHDERRELFRIAGVNALARSRDGRDLDPQALADVRNWAAYPPLKGPMGTGEPAA